MTKEQIMLKQIKQIIEDTASPQMPLSNVLIYDLIKEMEIDEENTGSYQSSGKPIK